MKISKKIETLAARVSATLVLAGVVAASTPATALPIEATVGSGANTASILIEFQDGAAFLFEVLFASVSISGIDAISELDASLGSFDVVLVDFGAFGFSVDGISYGAHSDVGYGGGELYWHYWTKEAENDPWSFSEVGASFRQLGDGSFDGWKYEALAPVPEPGTAVLVSIGLLGLGWKRRRERKTLAHSPR